VIRFFHRCIHFSSLIFFSVPSLFSLFLSHVPLALSFFSLFSYSTRQIIPRGILFPASVRSCGSEEEERATLSHLESNRGPLSKKLISLNIILGASGSRRALTNPSVYPRFPCLPPQNPPVSDPHFVSAPRTRSPSLFITPTRPSATASLLFALPPPPLASGPLPTLNFLMRKCFQRAGEKYCVYER